MNNKRNRIHSVTYTETLHPQPVHSLHSHFTLTIHHPLLLYKPNQCHFIYCQLTHANSLLHHSNKLITRCFAKMPLLCPKQILSPKHLLASQSNIHHLSFKHNFSILINAMARGGYDTTGLHASSAGYLARPFQVQPQPAINCTITNGAFIPFGIMYPQ